MPAPSPSRFGTSPVHVVKLIRRPGRHDLREVGVTLRCEASTGSGDLSTDTMTATVYAVAKDHPLDQIEEFGLSLNDYFLMAHPRLDRIDIELVEHPWRRLAISGLEQHHAFARVGEEMRAARISGTREDTRVEAGIDDLLVLRTTFDGNGSVEARAAPESDTLFAMSVTARWRYSRADVSFGLSWQGVRQVLLETFAEHRSRSAQATVHAMGEAVLQSIDDVADIRLAVHARPHRLVDLSALGVTNVDDVFAPSDDPHEVVEATLSRKR